MGWFLDDFAELLRLVQTGAGARLFLIASPENGKAIAANALANGITSIRWNGGDLGGVTLLVSDAQQADRLTLVSADSLAIKDSGISLRSSSQLLINRTMHQT